VPWSKVWKDPLKFIDEKYFPDEIQADDFRALKKEPSLMSKDALLACLNHWYTLQESDMLPFWFEYIPVGDTERRPSHTRSMLEEQEPEASTTRKPTAKARKAAKTTRKVASRRGKGRAPPKEHELDEDEEGEVAGSDTDEDNTVRTPAPKARKESTTTRKVLKGRGKVYSEANADEADEAGSDDGNTIRTPAPKARKASTTPRKVLKGRGKVYSVADADDAGSDEDNTVRTPAPKARKESTTTRKVLKGRGKVYPEADASEADEAGSDDGSTIRTPAPKAQKASTTRKEKATPKPTKELRRHSEDDESGSDNAPVCSITCIMRSLTDSYSRSGVEGVKGTRLGIFRRLL
jgi:uncharacterized cupredoxin-like copper-binding protein